MMKPKHLAATLGWCALALAVFAPQGRTLVAQTEVPRDTLLVAARTIMAAARYCALITVDDAGAPQVRTMDPFSPDDDMTIWLGTNRNTRKVEQIRRDPRVVLYYPSPNATGYVSISGRARLVEDEMEKASRWKPEWEAFYGDPAADYVLIEVVPERLEVIDYSRGIGADPRTWNPPFVVFR